MYYWSIRTIGVAADGSFVQVWIDTAGADGSQSGIFGQRFDASGNQDVTKSQPLFAHHPGRPRNPASVMKLETTFAALDLLGPDYRWRTGAYLGGPLDNGVLPGDLILKGRGDPKITIEQWQNLMGTLRANGLSAIDGDLVLDRSHFASAAHDPAAFDGEPQKPYNVGPDALLVNFKTVRFAFAPSASADAVDLKVEPLLANVAVGAPPRLAAGECGDWRAVGGATFVDRGARAEAAFVGRYPAACGEREWWVSPGTRSRFSGTLSASRAFTTLAALSGFSRGSRLCSSSSRRSSRWPSSCRSNLPSAARRSI